MTVRESAARHSQYGVTHRTQIARAAMKLFLLTAVLLQATPSCPRRAKSRRFRSTIHGESNAKPCDSGFHGRRDWASRRVGCFGRPSHRLECPRGPPGYNRACSTPAVSVALIAATAGSIAGSIAATAGSTGALTAASAGSTGVLIVASEDLHGRGLRLSSSHRVLDRRERLSGLCLRSPCPEGDGSTKGLPRGAGHEKSPVAKGGAQSCCAQCSAKNRRKRRARSLFWRTTAASVALSTTGKMTSHTAPAALSWRQVLGWTAP